MVEILVMVTCSRVCARGSFIVRSSWERDAFWDMLGAMVRGVKG